MTDLQQQLHARIDALRENGTLSYPEVMREIDACFALVEKYQFRDPSKGEVLKRLDLGDEKMCAHSAEAYVVRVSKDIPCDIFDRFAGGKHMASGLLSDWDIIPVPAEPKHTQEAWAVVLNETGRFVLIERDKLNASLKAAALFNEGAYTVVRIPPLPMETER